MYKDITWVLGRKHGEKKLYSAMAYRLVAIDPGKDVSDAFQEILLSQGETVELGRKQLVNSKEKRVSRKQVEISAYGPTVLLTQRGLNSCGIRCA